MENTVFVVTVKEGKSHDILSVFTSLEKAQAYKMGYVKEYNMTETDLVIFEEMLDIKFGE